MIVQVLMNWKKNAFLAKLKGLDSNKFVLVPLKLSSVCMTSFKLAYCYQPISETAVKIDRIIKLIIDHPFPASPLRPTLLQNVPAAFLSTMFVENVLGRLSAANSNSLKMFEFFKFALCHSKFCPSSDVFEKTLHILLQMRYFDEAWELMKEIGGRYPSLLSLKSMSIMLLRIAKFQSHEDTLRAFEKMEKEIFVGREFGTAEFNVLLQAFCTQRHIEEAHSVLEKMRSRFLPNTTTLNILLLGMRESDLAAMELFYHQLVRAGFKPNNTTYTIRISAYCKKGCFGDGLRLLEEMERVNCSPTLATLTALIHGAGVARNSSKALQLFEGIHRKNLQPDRGAYNALVASLAKANDLKSAFRLMGEMHEENIGLDDAAYHAMFLGLISSSDGINGVSNLYQQMIKTNFMPSTPTAITLMRILCQNSRGSLGLHFWRYLMERGYRPHRCMLDLLVARLCSRGKVEEALECSMQMLEKEMHISEGSFCLLERLLRKERKVYQLRMLEERIKSLRPNSPQPSSGGGQCRLRRRHRYRCGYRPPLIAGDVPRYLVPLPRRLRKALSKLEQP